MKQQAFKLSKPGVPEGHRPRFEPHGHPPKSYTAYCECGWSVDCEKHLPSRVWAEHVQPDWYATFTKRDRS